MSRKKSPLRLGALFFNDLECIRPTVVGDDDSRVSHEVSLPCYSVTLGAHDSVFRGAQIIVGYGGIGCDANHEY